MLKRFAYRQLRRADRGAVRAYVQRLAATAGRRSRGWSVARWRASRWSSATGRRRRPSPAATPAADVALLAEVDRAMGTLSGPATACVLRRQRDVFGDRRFERLARISVAHLYNLRASDRYRAAAGGDETGPARASRHDRRPQGARARGTPGLHPHRQRPPGRSSTAPRGCITSTPSIASRSGRWWPPCDASPRPSAAGADADAGAVSVRACRLSRRQRLRVRQPPCGATAREAAHRVHRSRPRHSNDNAPGRDQERRRGAQDLRLRAHPAAPRGRVQHLLPRIPEPVSELPSAVPVRHRDRRPQEARTPQAASTARATP